MVNLYVLPHYAMQHIVTVGIRFWQYSVRVL
jgi:hypothetical protein